jgi:hypothetical protein
MHPVRIGGRIIPESSTVSNNTRLKIVFSCISVAMIVCTAWASLHQSVLDWGGITRGSDRYWTTATLLDAYCGFLTFYVWVLFKEPRWLPRVAWFIAIMLLGNIAMSTYVLRQVWRLKPDEGAAELLTIRNS